MSSEQEFKCVFCNETFSQKEDLQIHFRKHGDPNFNQKKPRGRSQDESDLSAEKPKDQLEVVECDVCPEVFSTISKAITHKHKMHPDHDTKYFCPWCGKLFTMKHLYNKHMQATHLDMEKSSVRLFHCDTCDVDFNIPAAIAYHNKFYHRQDELPTIGHSKKLKMILEEVVQIYYCPFCGEEYDNKVNLHKHMTDDHCGENQSPEDVFRCPLCDAIFYYLDAYELHLTSHSIEDLYTERSEMMDEVTEFSLETVQPLQEKIESVVPVHEEEPTAIGIEELLEFTMDDSTDIRKHKKHKKHKKSKKAAITLDEFLNMNKDVFGEGIDFEGIEEVPTQAVAKRLKTKKVVPTSKFLSPDLAKLKRQGIVIKKQTTKSGKPVMKKDLKKVPNTALKTQKSINHMPQTKSNTLTSTDDVLSKLLNQGSQIKIIKKSNQDSEEHIQQEQENTAEERLSLKNMKTNDKEGMDQLNNKTATEEPSTETGRENAKINSIKQNSQVTSPSPQSPSIISHNSDLQALHNSDENSNSSAKFSDDVDKCPDQSEKSKNVTEKLTVLRKNSNIAIKLSKQNASETKDEYPDNTSDDIGSTQKKERDAQEDTERNTTTTEKSSLNALKHLSHLITIKPVIFNQTAPLPNDNKHENGIQKGETAISSQMPQNISPKTSDKMNFCNLKNLGSITIKPAIKSSLITSKNNTDMETGDMGEDHIDENHETDDEWNEDESIGNENNAEKIAHVLKSPQLSVQTKLSPKTIQKESPKATLNNDNSQSSADLLKHLKNVTAKPININSPKVPTPKSSPSAIKRSGKTTVQKEVTDDGTEIFSIDDSDSDDANGNHATSQDTIKSESKIGTNKSIDALKNMNKNIIIKSTNQQFNAERHSNKEIDDDVDDWDDDIDKKETYIKKNISPKPNQRHVAINNVLKNLSKNITVKSRNSSPSHPSIQSPDHNSRDSHLETNEADSDSDTPLSRVKITEMENSDDEIPESAENISHGNVKIKHPDDSHSEHEDGPMDEEFEDMSDFESHIPTAMVQKDNSKPNSSINSLKNLSKDLTIKSSNNKASLNNKPENSLPSEEIPQFAKNLSNQISIKQMKKPENNKNTKVEQTAAHSMNQSSINQKMASSSNQLNTINKEVKTVKTFQTQTKTVIQEITTTVTKTIKTVNQTTKQEVRNIAQSNTAPMIHQKVQGANTIFSQKNFQGVKVRQAAPNIRPKIRGQAPQAMRPAISAPPQGTRPAICPPVRASSQLVPVRPTFNRPTGPRPRMPNMANMRPSTSGQQRPQIGKPVKVSPSAIFSPPKKHAEVTGHFSCFKKPKESLIPVPDFPLMNKDDGEASVQFSSAMQMSKSNFSSTTKTVKGNSVVTSTQMKSEMSASSQQLSKLRNMSGLSVVKTIQNHAKQTQVEEKSEMSASKRNALEAIQKLQSQGLLVKKPRLDVSEDSDYSQTGSDDMGHNSNEDLDE